MKPDPTEFVSNYPRGEYAGRPMNLQIFKALLRSYERCTHLTALIVVMNITWIALMVAWSGSFFAILIGWAAVTVIALVQSDSITAPLERSQEEADEIASRLRMALALLAPFCLSLPLIFIQRRRIAREIQKYDRSLVGQLDSFRSTVLAMNLLPPVPVGPDAVTHIEQR